MEDILLDLMLSISSTRDFYGIIHWVLNSGRFARSPSHHRLVVASLLVRQGQQWNGIYLSIVAVLFQCNEIAFLMGNDLFDRIETLSLNCYRAFCTPGPAQRKRGRPIRSKKKPKSDVRIGLDRSIDGGNGEGLGRKTNERRQLGVSGTYSTLVVKSLIRRSQR